MKITNLGLFFNKQAILIGKIALDAVQKSDRSKEIVQAVVKPTPKITAENIQTKTELTQRQVVNQTSNKDLLELQDITLGDNASRAPSLNEILELLGLKLSNVPGAGNCGPWAILHANDPKKRNNSGTYNKVNDEITLFDVLNLKTKASEIATKQGSTRAGAIKKDHECMSTDDLIYYSQAINKPILCFNYYSDDVFVTLYKPNFDEKVLYYTKNKDIGDNVLAIILSGYEKIKSKSFPVLKLQNLINKEFGNPLMIYIGNGHFQSILPK